MHLKKSGVMVSTLAALSASTAFAATTPYDLIRPTWPLSWDAKVFENFDTTVTKKTGMLPKEATPASFKAGAMMPDTLDQAYFDAINTKISPIRMNQAGYLKSDTERQFYFVGSKATEFEVVDADGKSLSTQPKRPPRAAGLLSQVPTMQLPTSSVTRLKSPDLKAISLSAKSRRTYLPKSACASRSGTKSPAPSL